MAYVRNLARRIARKPVASAADDGEFDAGFYDAAYAEISEYGEHYSRSRYYFVWTVIADRLRLADPDGVLEVGCGPGQLANLLIDQGIRGYLGFDFSEVAIDIARRRGFGDFEVADARNTDLYSTHRYGAIVCTEVLEHIEDDLGVLDRVRPGVRCICTVPSFPYVSHVRHFESSDDVRARYAHYFEEFDLVELPMASGGGDRYYLFDGVRAAG